MRFNVAKESFIQLELMEEVFWEQKLRNKWLQEGDRNMKFFHNMSNERARKVTILEIGLVPSDKTSNLSIIKEVLSATSLSCLKLSKGSQLVISWMLF